MTVNDKAEIKRQFRESWMAVELFFASQIIIIERDFYVPLYRTLFIWRHLEYDHKLRAGLSVDSLILSRSKQHGLRSDQHALQIFAEDDTKLHVIYHDGTSNEPMSVDATTSSLIVADELQQLIDQLVAQPIN